MRWCLALVVCASCGDVEDKQIDAMVPEDTQSIDMMVDAPMLGTFGAAQRVDAVSSTTSSDDDASITADGLELYFASDRSGAGSAGDHIWVTKRASTTAAWDTPTPATGLNSTGTEGTGEVSGDGLTFWMISNRDGQTTAYDIYVSVRANRTAAWGTAVLATELNTVSDERSPRVDDSNKVMYLVSNRAGGTTGSDIYRTTRATIGAAWEVPERVASISTAMEEGSPAPAVNDSILVYSSNGDLYEVVRQNGVFGTPRAMTEINTASTENDAELSPDGRTLYFSRDNDIYMATR